MVGFNHIWRLEGRRGYMIVHYEKLGEQLVILSFGSILIPYVLCKCFFMSLYLKPLVQIINHRCSNFFHHIMITNAFWIDYYSIYYKINSICKMKRISLQQFCKHPEHVAFTLSNKWYMQIYIIYFWNINTNYINVSVYLKKKYIVIKKLKDNFVWNF